MRFIRRTGSKEQGSSQSVCAAGRRAVTELKCPKPVDLNRTSRRGMKQTNGLELTSVSELVGIKRMNASITEVADE